MGRYLIRDLEKISGIKAHTIRMWERRYNLIEPSRTKTNIRYYSDRDLKLLLNISILNNNGVKISHIASLSDEDIKSRVLWLTGNDNEKEVQQQQLLVAMIELDERRFNEIFSAHVLKFGFVDALERVIFPLLDKIGVLWQAGSISPAHEHFISSLIRQKIFSHLDNQVQKCPNNGCRIIMFLPEHELHEIGLLFYNLVAREMGFDVVYLGASVPATDLLLVNQARPCHCLMTAFVSALSRESIETLARSYRDMFPGVPVFVTGLQIKKLKPHLPSGFTVVSSAKSFREALDILKLPNC